MSDQGFGYAGYAALGQETDYGVPPAGTNAVQTITPSADLTGGAFTISAFGITTSSLAYNITLVELNAALLAAFGSTLQGSTEVPNVIATGGTLDAGTAFHLTFQGIYGSATVPVLTFGAVTVMVEPLQLRLPPLASHLRCFIKNCSMKVLS